MDIGCWTSEFLFRQIFLEIDNIQFLDNKQWRKGGAGGADNSTQNFRLLFPEKDHLRADVHGCIFYKEILLREAVKVEKKCFFFSDKNEKINIQSVKKNGIIYIDFILYLDLKTLLLFYLRPLKMSLEHQSPFVLKHPGLYMYIFDVIYIFA